MRLFTIVSKLVYNLYNLCTGPWFWPFFLGVNSVGFSCLLKRVR